MNEHIDTLNFFSKIDLKKIKTCLPSYKIVIPLFLISFILLSFTIPKPVLLYQAKIFIPRTNGTNASYCVNLATAIQGLEYRPKLLELLKLNDIPSFDVSIVDINGGSLMIFNHRGNSANQMDSIVNHALSQCNISALATQNRLIEKIKNLRSIREKLILISKNLPFDSTGLPTLVSIENQNAEAIYNAEEVNSSYSPGYLYSRNASTSAISSFYAISRAILLSFVFIVLFITAKYIFKYKLTSKV